MAASQFIALLESRGLLDPEIIAELHRQVEHSKVRVTPEAIAKLLVDNGQLTRFQATKLVTELNESLGSARPDPTAALRGGRPIDPVPNDHDSVEDLLPDDVVQIDDEVEVVEVVEDQVQEVEVVQSAVTAATATPVRAVATSRDFDVTPKRVSSDTTVSSRNAWESFRILGYGFFFLLLLIIFIPLFGWFSRGSAERAWTTAEEAYKARNYEQAARGFTEFAKNFSSDERSSQARVLSVVGRIRQDAEKNADPTIALALGQELLPTIVNEQSLGPLRGDITDTLLRISEKFVLKIGNTQSIPDRKVLLEKMNNHMELVKDPRYVGTQERTQNELRIRKIEEDQNRLIRDIQKGEEHAATLLSMAASVEAKDVSKTYELRRALIRKYPQLELDAKVNALLDEATKLQKSGVVPASGIPEVSNEPIPNDGSIKKAILIGRRSNEVEVANSGIVYVKHAGSVLALNASSGRFLWRHHIGLDWSGVSKRFSATGDSDVLISLPEQGILRRLSAKDGSLVWQAKFSGRLTEPAIDGDDVLVSTTSGELYCLDSFTGQSRWGKKIPQSLDVNIGTTGKEKRYLLGNHSNLYVMTRASGNCDEVTYVGHAPSTVAVPPVWISNQVILFENEGPDYCLMRVFTTDEKGANLTPAQKPMRLKGHVVVEPQVDGRRLVVVTNLGEIAILDVDSLSTGDKVVKLVSVIENESSPKIAWPLIVGNDLWMASTRLAYYQVQVTSQKLNQKWLREDGDRFTGRPMMIDEIVVHSRVVRGNLGLRVTGIKPDTGDPIWETDIGVPVTSITSDGKGFVALTAQGAVYSLEGKSFGNDVPTEPIENLGRNQRMMKFLTPLPLKDSRVAVLNQAQGNQLLTIDPAKRTTSPSRILSMEISGTFPSGEPIAIGNGSLVVPLNNSQIAMIDSEKGAMIGTPFQPSLQAGERPVWLNPVVLSDGQTVIVADQNRFMYKLSTGRQLRTVTSQALEKPLKGRLSVIKDVIVGVSSNASGDQLDFYDSGELKRTSFVPVEGRFATWGPHVVEKADSGLMLAFSDIDGLVACDETGKKLWSRPIANVVLVGKPVVVESDCIIATTSGELIRISLADGTVVARRNIGEAICGTPIVLPKGLLIPGEEGCVLTVPMLTAQTQDLGTN